MIIKVDAQGKGAIELLCDQTLKAVGVNGLELVNTVLSSLELAEENKSNKKGTK